VLNGASQEAQLAKWDEPDWVMNAVPDPNVGDNTPFALSAVA